MTSVLNGDTGVKDRGTLPPSVVDRMTLIMESFGDVHTRLTLEEIAGRTGLPRSTSHRILERLVNLAWLGRHGRVYCLGDRALGLGGREEGYITLRSVAYPLLHDLAMRTDMVVHLAVLDGTDVVYVDKFGGRAAAGVPSVVGGHAPAWCTAVGKAILAWLPAEQVDSRLPDGLSRRTTRSIDSLGVLHMELNRIRNRHGLAFERGECFPNIACAGMAVRRPDGPIAGVSLVGDAQAPLERLAPLMVNTVHAISEKMSSDSRQRHLLRLDSTVPAGRARGVSPSEALGRLVALGERGEWF